MKSFKKIALALLAVAAFAGAACAENRLEKVMRTKKLTVATEPYFAPYEFIDNTKSGQEAIRGADVELARFITEHMGVELELVSLSFDAVLSGIAQGKYDLAISALAYTPQRAQSLELSNSYEQGSDQHGLLVLKENVDKYTSFADFDGKTVGAHSGTLQEQLVAQQLPKAKARIFDSIQNAVLAVDAGKIDAVAVSVDNGEMFVAAHPSLAILPMRFELDTSSVCVAATKGETELIARVNEIVAELNKTDLFDTWKKSATEEAAQLGIK